MACTAAVNTLKALILGAPDGLRQALRGLSTPRQAARCRTLRVHGPVDELQQSQRRIAGKSWQEHGLVFASSVGTKRNANNVLRSFRAVVAKTTLTAEDWTPREMRHSFVSLLSDSGVPIENIARLVGHAGGSEVTETVYRKQIRPVLLDGAEAMDRIFSDATGLHSHPDSHSLGTKAPDRKSGEGP